MSFKQNNNMLVQIEKRKENDITIKEVESTIYDYDDIASAINTIIDNFKDWKGCTLKRNLLCRR